VEPGESRLMLAEDCERFAEFAVPNKAEYALVGSLDGISLLRRDAQTLVSDEDRKAYQRFQPGPSTQDLSANAILDRGRLVGLWEYDTATESIAWMSFAPANKAMKNAVRRTEEYIRAQLGDARSFGLDSPKSRAPKVEALRQAAGR